MGRMNERTKEYEWKISVALTPRSLGKKWQDMTDLEKFFAGKLGDEPYVLHKRCASVVGVKNDVHQIESYGLKIVEIKCRPICEWKTISKEELSRLDEFGDPQELQRQGQSEE